MVLILYHAIHWVPAQNAPSNALSNALLTGGGGRCFDLCTSVILRGRALLRDI
jgi:hypothetical protein